MAVVLYGTRITFNESNDSITLNCPIKHVQYAAGTAGNLMIDGMNFYVGATKDGIKFHSVHGYPGAVLSVGDISSPVVVNIAEIGDVLNPNYFKEDISNWNGQGATAVATETADVSETPDASETESPKKTARTKKAEVNE